MANFNNLSLTTRGVKSLLEAQAGKTLTLSKIGLGSGNPASGIASVANLVTPELMLPISEKKIDSDSGLMTIIAKMTNEDIAKGFYWRETGLFYQDSDGNDVLFAYAYTADQYDYVPSYSDQRYVKHIRITNIITDKADIEVKEAEGLLYVDTLTFNEFKEEFESHNHDNLYYSQNEVDEIRKALETLINAKPSTLSALGITATAEELNYMHGVTSNVQDQLNDKAASSHGNHVPTTQTADNATFLRNDNTWQKVTPANIGAAASSHGVHVTYTDANPVMDGTASAGSAETVARSDHKHPSDTSRIATSKIIKTLGTTEEGFVPDATLVTTLYNMLTGDSNVKTASVVLSNTGVYVWSHGAGAEETSWTPLNGDYTLYLTKLGKLINIRGTISAKTALADSEFTSVFANAIPSGFRPPVNTYIDFEYGAQTINGKTAMGSNHSKAGFSLMIAPDGTLSSKMGTNSNIGNNATMSGLTCNATYVCA